MSKTRQLLAQTKEGNQEARNMLVEENLGLVHHVIKRFTGRGMEMQDLFQIGTIGLIKAIERFDIEREVQFSTYAVPMIIGEIKRFLRDDGMLKVSRGLKENGYRIYRIREQFQHEHGREPMIGELEEISGLSSEEIIEATEACADVESLQKEVFQNDGSKICLADRMKTCENEKEDLMNHLVLEQLVKSLPTDERKLIYFRYMKEETQVEVAKKLGISQVQVSRIEKKILLKMKSQLCGEQKEKTFLEK